MPKTSTSGNTPVHLPSAPTARVRSPYPSHISPHSLLFTLSLLVSKAYHQPKTTDLICAESPNSSPFLLPTNTSSPSGSLFKLLWSFSTFANGNPTNRHQHIHHRRIRHTNLQPGFLLRLAGAAARPAQMETEGCKWHDGGPECDQYAHGSGDRGVLRFKRGEQCSDGVVHVTFL